MSDRPLAGSTATVRKGQTILKTECESCGATMRNPSSAAQHVHKRGKGHFTRRGKAQNEVINHALPPGFEGINGGRQEVSEQVVCIPTCWDRGDHWLITPCLCACHYQGRSARQLIKEAHSDVQ